MRLILDANVFVSALISRRGAPALILQRWKRGEFEVLVSPPILAELERVLRYPRIPEKYHLEDQVISRLLELLVSVAILVTPSEPVTLVEQDPTDNIYLECAITGQAAYIISGDKHLLEVGEYQGIVVLPPAGFIALLEASE